MKTTLRTSVDEKVKTKESHNLKCQLNTMISKYEKAQCDLEASIRTKECLRRYVIRSFRVQFTSLLVSSVDYIFTRFECSLYLYSFRV